MERIMSEKKTASSYLRNPDSKTVKAETEKINDLLTNISSNNITELNDQIYTGTKLVCGKIRVLPKNTIRESKPRWEIKLEIQVRKLRQQAKNANTCEKHEKIKKIPKQD